MGMWIEWNGWTKETKLVTHPHVHPNLLWNWKQIAYFYRRIFKSEEYFERHLPLRFPFIKYGIQFRGHSAVTAAQVAHTLGYSPIYLVGVDLGWRDPKKIRIDTYEPQSIDGPITVKAPLPEKEYLRLNKSCVLIETEGMHCWKHEKKAKLHLLEFWNENDVKLINCSDGRLDSSDMPQADIVRIIEINANTKE